MARSIRLSPIARFGVGITFEPWEFTMNTRITRLCCGKRRMTPATLGPILLATWTAFQSDPAYARIPYLEYLSDISAQPDDETLRAILQDPFDGLPIVLFSPQVPCAAGDRIEAASVPIKRQPIAPNLNRRLRDASPPPECNSPAPPPPLLRRRPWCAVPPVEFGLDRIDSTFERSQRRAILEPFANHSTVGASGGRRAPISGNGARTEQPCHGASPILRSNQCQRFCNLP